MAELTLLRCNSAGLGSVGILNLMIGLLSHPLRDCVCDGMVTLKLWKKHQTPFKCIQYLLHEILRRGIASLPLSLHYWSWFVS